MLGTITFILILLLVITFMLQVTKKPSGKGIVWWIKLFILYIALMIIAGILWLFSLPLFVGMRRLPPFAIIIPVHTGLTQIMMWIMPIGFTIAVVLYFVYLILRPIILGITLGIVDIAGYTPFKEFIEMGIFDLIEAILTLDVRRAFNACKKILIKTPEFFRELFFNEINAIEGAAKQGEESAKKALAERDKRVQECIQKNSIEITDLMTTAERKKAELKNEKIEKECKLTE